MSDDTEQDRLFEAVLTEGTDEAADAWIGAGPEGVARLRLELSGERRTRMSSKVYPRDHLDYLGMATRRIATAYPDEFLAAFPSSEWDDNSLVCGGLGGIRRPDVTLRLMRLLSHPDKWVRVQAAAGLRGHEHRGLESALLMARSDPDDLVRYHVEERLRELD